MTRSVIILQARMASERLRGKVLAPIGARSMLAHCIARLRIGAAAPVMVATTTNAEDDCLAAIGARYDVPVFRGPSEDVLSRFVMAARSVGAQYVVRATADNPAIDIGGAGRLLAHLQSVRADYAIEDAQSTHISRACSRCMVWCARSRSNSSGTSWRPSRSP